MKKLETRHKIGVAIMAAGVLAAGASLAFPAAASVLVIVGVGLILVGAFVIRPDFAF